MRGVRETVADAVATSAVETQGSAAYAFMPTLSPDIDYSARFHFERRPGGRTQVSGSIEHNLFPFYEVLINGRTLWTFSSSDTGPTLVNLNSSVRESLGPWGF